MDVFVHYDTLLKSVYAFYATLDFPTYDNSNWKSAPAALSVRMRDLSHYIQSDLQVKFLMDSSYKPVVPERETVGPELEMFEKRMKSRHSRSFKASRSNGTHNATAWASGSSPSPVTLTIAPANFHSFHVRACTA
ncbi:hypothetical protein CYMTET_17558 [Cymbomonas tetramitiformis]|uniref:Uncharacterized protein n=1 Tax=Cymbomonas tetramitiformis TaxID=36881 RepID=A0AAE0GA47_9CHLO|nr:hypothetical protein CYMTET_17558 [Cymbomonas tetramitiformis]